MSLSSHIVYVLVVVFGFQQKCMESRFNYHQHHHQKSDGDVPQIYLNEFVVEIDEVADADKIAKNFGFVNLGPVNKDCVVYGNALVRVSKRIRD